jgi:SNF2 family DNA or RNA helicase
VRLDTAAGKRDKLPKGRAGAVWARVLPRFRPGSGELGDTAFGKSERRLALVADLLRAARHDGGDPALLALLERERDELERSQRGGALVRTARRRIAGFKRQLYPYQVEGVRRLLSGGRLLLADDMGLGKTVQAIAACHILVSEGRVQRGLVIVPASLKSQWLREWQESSDVPIAAVDGLPSQRAAQYRALRRGFLILGYEQLLRDLTYVHELAPDMVVLDEAQRIKNWATKTATYVKSLRPSYRLVLTGTPMENRLEEVASIFDWVDDLALEPKWRLTPWHTYADSDGDRGQSGARHLDTLRARMAPAMLRRVRSEVLSQLPPRTDVRVPVELTPQQLDAHRDLDQPIAKLMSIARRRPLRQPEFLRLMSLLTTQRIICNGIAQLEFEQMWPACAELPPTPRLLEGLFAPKLGELRRLVADVALEQQRKVVIFSQWRRMLRLAHWALSDLLEDAGVGAVFFTGAESQKQRTRSVIELHDDPRVRVMLLSDAGGVGLNLQRAASCCINIELPWNPAVLEQRIGRIYRLGQSLPIDVYNLVSEGGIESRIAAVVSDKQALFSGLFDGTTNDLAFDGGASFMSRVEKLVEPVVLPEQLGTVETRARGSLSRARGQANGKANGGGDVDAHAHLALADEPEGLGEQAAGRAVEAIVAAADESGDAPAPTTSPSPRGGATPSREGGLGQQGVQQLLGSLRVRTTSAGGIAIEAPPESAAALASLFGKMAELLAAGARAS